MKLLRSCQNDIVNKEIYQNYFVIIPKFLQHKKLHFLNILVVGNEVSLNYKDNIVYNL